MTEFAQKLKDHNLTIAEFCRFAEIPRPTVEGWLYQGKRTPKYARKMLKCYVILRDSGLLDEIKGEK